MYLYLYCICICIVFVARAARTDGSASESCADNDWKNNVSVTTTCERFISLVKPSILG